jgi:hypothetical protein
MNTTIVEIESIISICTRGLEIADDPTRQSFARLVGHLLASTQADRPQLLSGPHAGSLGGVSDETILPSQGPLENKFTLSVEEMMGQLSTQFNRLSASRKIRVGIFQFYAELLIKLGATFVESKYGAVVAHFMTEIVSNSRNSSSRYEALLVRKLVEIILRNLIGIRMLGEQAQIAAIQELSRSYLKRWPAIMPGQVSPNTLILAIILQETAGLLQQLGNTPPPVQVGYYHRSCLRYGIHCDSTIGCAFRLSYNIACSPQQHNSHPRFTNASSLLFFNTPAASKNNTHCHGVATS